MTQEQLINRIYEFHTEVLQAFEASEIHPASPIYRCDLIPFLNQFGKLEKAIIEEKTDFNRFESDIQRLELAKNEVVKKIKPFIVKKSPPPPSSPFFLPCGVAYGEEGSSLFVSKKRTENSSLFRIIGKWSCCNHPL